MDNEKIAKELVAVAKELTAGPKVTKTFHRDRDRYDEVDIIVEIPVGFINPEELIDRIENAVKIIARERKAIIRHFGAKPDPFGTERIEVKNREIIIKGGFATTLLSNDFAEIERMGIKIL